MTEANSNIIEILIKCYQYST